jgi:hypothetical protein
MTSAKTFADKKSAEDNNLLIESADKKMICWRQTSADKNKICGQETSSYTTCLRKARLLMMENILNDFLNEQMINMTINVPLQHISDAHDINDNDMR